MPVNFETLTKEALDLTPRQRLKLAEVLLVSTDGELENDCESAWDSEIEARILAIGEGRETGVSFEEVIADADKILAQSRSGHHPAAGYVHQHDHHPSTRAEPACGPSRPQRPLR